MLAGLKARFPKAHLKAFTAIEIGWFAKKEKISIEETLRRFVAAGLGSLPGGGAEIFHPEVRAVICDGKLDADEWIEVHRVAHRMGIRSNCTMLYGHVEKPEHRVDHLLKLRALQDESGGFNAYIPLAYHPENNYMGLKYHTTGLDDLREIATARLVLDNIPHVKAYWVMVTPKLAQVALSFGADDLDGTVVEETIYHMAGAATGQMLPRAELERVVRALLRNVGGARFVELPYSEDCCGFGGVFSVEHPEISAEMLKRKLANGEASQAAWVVSCDAGCVTNIIGGLHRQGKLQRAVHIAEILAHQ